MTVVTAYGGQVDRLRDTVATLAERLWMDMPYYTDEAVPIWYDRIAPVVRGGQAAAVTAHDAYLAAYLERDVLGIDPDAAIARGSTVSFETVHRAPFLRTWKHVADGYPFSEARQTGAKLAGLSVTEDVQRAALGANAIGLEAHGVQAYRRVVSGAKTCSFCYTAAGQTYSRSDLMPVHPKCDCIVVPIAGRDYVAKAGQRGIGTRYDREGRAVSRPTAEDEAARKAASRSTEDRARTAGNTTVA